ncbi:MAG: reprolysin-like metallopeptidase [Chthoniobacteraceae bacterium]
MRPRRGDCAHPGWFQELATQSEQSMNLEQFHIGATDPDEFRQIVLHEFGHALGLEHEHQSPMSKCKDEFDWSKIYSYLGGEPNYWSPDTVDFNMGILNEVGLLVENFDSASIMLYTFPAEYFKEGRRATCFSEPNLSLSEGDKRIMGAIYPNSGDERSSLVERIRTHFIQRVEASGAVQGSKSAVMQLLREYLPQSN